jgi:5-methylthioadenosine/S-adenosylhomocysteine deaminase
MNGRREVIEDGAILIEGQRIQTVGQVEASADEVIDAAGMVALPGFVNAHTHAAMTLMRGYADDMPLMPWLQEKIWPAETKMLEGGFAEEAVYWGTMLACVEMIRGGTTCFNDMYHTFAAATRAMIDSGIRACPSGVLLGFLPNAPQRLEKAIDFCREMNGAADGRIQVMLAPHALYTVEPPLLKRVREAALELGIPIHTHLQETQDEMKQIAQKYNGKSAIQVMNKIGVFDAPTVAAHCVYVSDEDVDILREKRVAVAHNPTSNMKLASGIAPIPRYLKEGVLVGIGTDGTASNNDLDMLEEMRLAAFLGKVSTLDPTAVDAYTALELATRKGAECLRLENDIGQIAPGFKADVALFDFNQPHLTPRHNVISHLVYAAQASDVHTVIINGKVVLRNRAFTELDEEKIMAEASRFAARMTGK